MVSVLFVCLGNICRSPMAEAIFRQSVSDAGLEHQIQVASAGTSGQHDGEPPHEGTQAQLNEAGIAFDSIRSQKLRAEMVEDSTYVIVMDDENLADVQQLVPAHSERILRCIDLIPEPGAHQHIPDPWFTQDFLTTYRLLQAGCQHLLTKICREQQLVPQA